MEDSDIILEYEAEKKKQKNKYIIIMIVVAIVVAIASSEFTLFYYSNINKLKKIEAGENAEENLEVISENLKSFRELIDEYFIGEIDEGKILDETIKGYVNGLDDEYSEYMTAEEWEDFQTAALGNYVGIGIYMGVDQDNNIVVTSVIADSPAEEVGLKSGDIIVKVNDENVLGTSSEIVSSKVKGEAGTSVKLTVYRDPEYLDFDIKRKEIKVYHVEKKMLENNIGYMALRTFDEGCSEEIENAYNELKSQGANKIILDLRNNTGGLVEEALSIAELAVEKDKTLLVTVDAKGDKEITKSEKTPIINEEMVILVNEYSASASEILVGALRDNEKAKIVGTTTYGKGVIQSVFLLNDDSALKLTISEYFTPNETKINKVGITPDFEVKLDEKTEEDEQLNKAIELLK